MDSKRSHIGLMVLSLSILWSCYAGLAIAQPAGPYNSWMTPHFGAPKAQKLMPIEGHGMLQGGERNNALSNAQFANPKLKFFVLRDRWYKMEPKKGVYNFTYNANQIRRARKAGKGYIVATMTGAGCTPDFVAGPKYKNNRGELTLAPWSPAIAKAWSDFIWAQANTEVDGIKVKDDPYNLGVWCNGPTVPSQEMHLNGLENASGYNPAGIVANWKACIKATHAAFPDKPGILALSGQPAVLKYQAQVIAAMEAEYGKNAVFQHNSLGKQTSVSAPHHQAVLAQGKKGYRIGAEMVRPKNTEGLAKFPERDYNVLYSGDEKFIK